MTIILTLWYWFMLLFLLAVLFKINPGIGCITILLGILLTGLLIHFNKNDKVIEGTLTISSPLSVYNDEAYYLDDYEENEFLKIDGDFIKVRVVKDKEVEELVLKRSEVTLKESSLNRSIIEGYHSEETETIIYLNKEAYQKFKEEQAELE